MARVITDQQRRFVQNFVAGMNQTQAARTAGYAFPSVEAVDLMRHPGVKMAIARERERYEQKADISRQKVMDGLLDAIEIARLQADATGMVAGWREIARICGYYAPEKKQLDISITANLKLNQIEQLSDAELAKLITDAEFSAVEEDEPALLEAPTDDEVSPAG